MITRGQILSTLTEAEFERGRALYSLNFIRQIWHRADMPGACLLVEAESEQQVREMLSTLPLFRAGMLEIMVIPLKPYAGFGPRRSCDGVTGDGIADSGTLRNSAGS